VQEKKAAGLFPEDPVGWRVAAALSSPPQWLRALAQMHFAIATPVLLVQS